MSSITEADILAQLFSPIQLLVYDTIIKCGPMTRDAIVQKLCVPRTTVYDAIKLLESKGLAARRPIYHFGPMNRGRPKVEFYLPGRDDR